MGEMAEATLLSGTTVWTVDSTDAQDPNHAVRMIIQLGSSVEEEVMMQLIGKICAPKFFENLRTQQQLGYVVQMAVSPGCSFTNLIAVVQGEFHPDYARSRIAVFLDEHFAWIEATLEEEE